MESFLVRTGGLNTQEVIPFIIPFCFINRASQYFAPSLPGTLKCTRQRGEKGSSPLAAARSGQGRVGDQEEAYPLASSLSSGGLGKELAHVKFTEISLYPRGETLVSPGVSFLCPSPPAVFSEWKFLLLTFILPAHGNANTFTKLFTTVWAFCASVASPHRNPQANVLLFQFNESLAHTDSKWQIIKKLSLCSSLFVLSA